MNMQTFLIICAAAFMTSACGGGSSNDSPPPAATDAVPDSASQSADGMNAWLTALSNDATDVKEPLDLARFTPRTSDDTEPSALK